jgi:hypothetical protein
MVTVLIVPVFYRIISLLIFNYFSSYYSVLIYSFDKINNCAKFVIHLFSLRNL